MVVFTTVNTSGWQNWTSVTTQIMIKEGLQYIDLYSRTGNMNVNWLNFEYIGDSIEDTSTVPSTVDSEKTFNPHQTLQPIAMVLLKPPLAHSTIII